MNPSGYRIEEKKSIDPEPSYSYDYNNSKSFDSPSPKSPASSSYKSTQSSRSSVLQRAREYSKRIEEKHNNTSTIPKEEDWYHHHRRSKSAERINSAEGDRGEENNKQSINSASPRSQSANRAIQVSSSSAAGARPSTRERALATVRKDFEKYNKNNRNNALTKQQSQQPTRSYSQSTPALRSPVTTYSNATSTSSRPLSSNRYPSHTATNTTPESVSNNLVSRSPYQQQHSQTKPTTMSNDYNINRSASKQSDMINNSNSQSTRSRTPVNSNSASRMNPSSRNNMVPDSPSRSAQSQPPFNQHQQNQQQAPVVTPELLVDALSGHEDGLLAIAEKLMEHYDAGYDVMGEAIIDAFADVQKLFQHVVEAAHMEGAAFEASRRDEELSELRRQVAAGGGSAADLIASGFVDESSFLLLNEGAKTDGPNNTSANSPSGPSRHDEFIDQDVKDILTEAIRKGGVLRSENKHKECYELFERSCQDASSLLPVDSDHRGRLQLSLTRAESMSPERSCAILRYAMDDVLRSGMRAHRTPLPDPSKRADVVLNRPKGHPSLTAATGQVMAGVIQSSDEALASLMEEMKDILSAPIYDDTPLQNVAKRFWAALSDSQKIQQKNAERLEQNLGKLKGEFLLARAEWEEKLSKTTETADSYKEKYLKLKESRKNEGYMDQARAFSSSVSEDGYSHGGVRSVQSKAGSVVSGVSGLAQQAKTIVSQMNNFNCTGANERNNESVLDDYDDYDGGDDSALLEMDARHDTKRNNHRGRVPLSQRSYDSSTATSTSTPQETKQPHRNQNPTDRSRSNPRVTPSRSFREYSKSPKRVDV